jgi:hypothetical protein
MVQRSLQWFTEKTRNAWGPLTSEVVAGVQKSLEELVRDPETEIWLRPALTDSPAGLELYRDPDHGFVLSAYTETSEQYRIPHDHGSGWVVYAVLNGAMEMETYARAINQQGKLQLVNRERYRMLPGDSKVFLPLDIHDTRCVSETVTILRFTSCDLKREDREGRMIRYSEGSASGSAGQS